MSDAAFDLDNVSFAYGKHTVLRDISFKIPTGKITTLMGANGCGKTTLFNLMTKNLRPDKGKIALNGEDINTISLREYAKRAAIVHQNNTAPNDITVQQLVEYGRTPFRSFAKPHDKEEDSEKVNWAMEITQVQKHKDKPVSRLSGGQRQRVWIAMALAQDTKILFLDEPTTYLDIRYQVQILQLIRRLNGEFGITIVMVLHDINQALYFSDEILALSCEGEVISQGAPESVITENLIEHVYGIKLNVVSVSGKQFVMTV